MNDDGCGRAANTYGCGDEYAYFGEVRKLSELVHALFFMMIVDPFGPQRGTCCLYASTYVEQHISMRLILFWGSLGYAE